ncbi:hypothetical protein [Vulcanisaeta sp. JCM 16159]|uniref:hypothetical protein n=1 Tax=Vulcanisaeta sp. JCM 16159 TaxID=1295371 RepID=UPI000A677A3B|nr:hypothetical protein [Vulcanisaeta sp. JCM 16159]
MALADLVLEGLTLALTIALGLVLGTNQYYVYTLGLNYEPASMAVLASSTNYPGIIKEFSANVSTINSIPLIPQTQSQPSPSLIDVVVNDPSNAFWVVKWGFNTTPHYGWTCNNGLCTYGLISGYKSGASSATWLIPVTPHTVVYFAAASQCTIAPANTTATAGQTVVFNVNCAGQPQAYNVTVDVSAPYGIAFYDLDVWVSAPNIQPIEVYSWFTPYGSTTATYHIIMYGGITYWFSYVTFYIYIRR